MQGQGGSEGLIRRAIADLRAAPRSGSKVSGISDIRAALMSRLLSRLEGTRPSTEALQRVATPWGDRVLVSGDVAQRLQTRAGYEREEMAVMKQFLEQDSSVVDVGANVGLYALMFAHAAPRGRVLAIEADPVVGATLQENLSRNGVADRVHVELVAAGSSPGKATLFVASDGAYSSVIPTNRKAVVRQVEVPVRRIDDIASESSMSGVSALKIDVEGQELEVVRGARTILRSDRCSVALVELNPSHLASARASVPEVVTEMRSLGYKPFFAAKGGGLRTYSSAQHGRYENVFFLR